jgi:hypothetical protein
MHSKFQVLHIPLAHWETSKGPHHKGSLFSYKLEDKYKIHEIYGEACNLPVEKNEAVAAAKNTLCREE